MSDKNTTQLALYNLLSPIRKWGTKWSLWPVHFVTSCCGVEFAHTASPGYDAERWGFLNFGICRQTNVIIVEGTITKKMAKILKFTYDQMPDPKYVLQMGACGLRGGLFWNAYSIVDPSEIVPIDFYVPGCPPTPESLIRAIRLLQNKIATGESRTSIKFNPADMNTLLKIPKKSDCEVPKAKMAPKSPKKIAREPTIKIDVPKKVNWPFGNEIVKNLENSLKDVLESVTITGVNRICIFVKKENLESAAKILTKNFDHAKSVNVIDVPHENKFIVEYTLSNYRDKALMPALVTLSTEIPRDDAKVSSLATYWPSADYYEREMFDYFGVWFEGNEAMGRNFLVSVDSPQFPLRKSHKIAQEQYVTEEAKK